VFGERASKYSLWEIDVSPGLIGQGIIAGEGVAFSALIGALYGWVLLPYLIQKYDWGLSGDRDDRPDCIRRWIVWPALAALLADCLGAILVSAWRAVRRAFESRLPEQARPDSSSSHIYNSASPITITPSCGAGNAQGTNRCQEYVTREESYTSKLSPGRIWSSLTLTAALCIASTHYSTRGIMQWYNTLAAMILTVPLALMGIHAVGHTGFNPVSALGTNEFLLLINILGPVTDIVN